MNKISSDQLKIRQAYPLDLKVQLSANRIRQWYQHFNGQVYVSFSGGKDSTVLLDLVRRQYPEVPAVFVNTGQEYSEIIRFVKSVDNVIWVKPKMTFWEVVDKYGWPVVSKEQSCAISRYRNTKDPVQKYRRLNGWPNGKKGMISKKWQYLIDAPFKISDKCCDILKKEPMDRYAKESGRRPISGIMSNESRQRQMGYLKYGCNAFGVKKPMSKPLSFWTEDDIWGEIKKGNLPYSDIYNKGELRTGCKYCMFGCHMEEEPNRFQRMRKRTPGQFENLRRHGGCDVLDVLRVSYETPKLLF